MNYRIHPVADMFPMLEMSSPAWAELLDSIDALGQLEPIIVDGDILIDGRNRLAVCECLRLEPKVIQWSEIDARGASQADWIFAKNYNRRSLTEEQRVAVAVLYNNYEEAELKKKETQFKPGESGNPSGTKQVRTKSSEPARDHKKEQSQSTVGKIAAKAKVSHHKARMAVALAKRAKTDPEAAKELEAVRRGEKKLRDTSVGEPKGRAMKPKPLKDRVHKEWKAFFAKFDQSEHKQVKRFVMEFL